METPDHKYFTNSYLIISFALDTTKLNKKYEIVGGCGYGKGHPKHKESIDKDCYELAIIEVATEKELSDEITCVIIDARNIVIDALPVRVIAARSGSKNEVCHTLENSGLASVENNKKIKCISVYMDGISSEAVFNRE